VTCEIKRDPTGRVVIITCGRQTRMRVKPCASCGRPGGLLCDFPIATKPDGSIQTCDAEICPKCTDRVAPGIDHCPKHQKAQAAK
jgi:hypothetical protein